jgi:photosystem II stability/assembly factor-like uncharacterized protein
MGKKKQIRGVFSFFLVAFLALNTFALCQEGFNEDLLKGFTYRNIGPFRSSAWISDIAVPEIPQKEHLYTFYIAARCGGLWKTTNNGTTFTPVIDQENVYAIGDVTLAPSNPNIVWVGSGGQENSRSAYSGDGVYKSMDGGETWENMGLKDSHHIGRIVIHPRNPQVVYVAAIGHLFSFNEERGLFKTEDGGKTWKKVLYISGKVGVVDVVINRTHPDTLYASSYEMQRLPWHFERGGPGSAIYKTTDAGETWTKLGGGLPGGRVGRIGLDIYQKNPDILYAVVENAQSRPPTEEEIEQDRMRGRGPRERIVGGEIYRTDDGGTTWKKTNISVNTNYSYGWIRIDPNDDKTIYVPTGTLYRSSDAGETWDRDEEGRIINYCLGAFGDNRSFWIDPENSDRLILGNDGGVHITYDRAKTWDSHYNIPIGEFYAIGVDMEEPYNVYGGLQDHVSWKGPSNSWSGRVNLADWVTVGDGDGMYNQVDPNDSRWLYNTMQFGGHYRVDQELGIRKSIQPENEAGKPRYRFTWIAPLHLSPHNSQIIYTGGQYLLRSMDRGDTWQEISPDLTTNDPEKIAGFGNIQYCCMTTISESPVTPGVIWIGTDDGRVWLTKDYGANWNEMTNKIAAVGGPENIYVSRVFASSFQDGTAYVAKSGYRRDDFRPFLYKTNDFGATWTSIAGNLPDKPINVIFEDRKNPNLLFVGNDLGVYVTIDGGKKWVWMKNNMPAVAVHDLLVHPRENDLVVGTYGRGIFITDISPLQELNEGVLQEDIHFFKVEPKAQLITSAWGWYHLYGNRNHFTRNESNALVINYYLKNSVDEEVKIFIANPYGEVLAELEGKSDSGMNRVAWDMQRRFSPEEEAAARRQRGRDPFSRLMPPGEYVVRLEVGEKRFTQKTRITKRIGWTIGPLPRKIGDDRTEE